MRFEDDRRQPLALGDTLEAAAPYHLQLNQPQDERGQDCHHAHREYGDAPPDDDAMLGAEAYVRMGPDVAAGASGRRAASCSTCHRRTRLDSSASTINRSASSAVTARLLHSPRSVRLAGLGLAPQQQGPEALPHGGLRGRLCGQRDRRQDERRHLLGVRLDHAEVPHGHPFDPFG